MDDPLEKYVKKLDLDPKDKHLKFVRSDFGKFCFISCWTYAEEELISMWDMYGDRKNGVRIGLPIDMFDSTFNINASRENNVKPLFELKKEQYVQPEFIEVDYSRLDDPKLVVNDWKIEIGNLGKYKTRDWAFQKECRFRLYAAETSENKEQWFVPVENKSFVGLVSYKPSSLSYVDFPMNNNAYNNIQIVVGPNMNYGKRVMLNGLIDEYNLDRERVFESRFKLDFEGLRFELDEDRSKS